MYVRMLGSLKLEKERRKKPQRECKIMNLSKENTGYIAFVSCPATDDVFPCIKK